MDNDKVEGSMNGEPLFKECLRQDAIKDRTSNIVFEGKGTPMRCDHFGSNNFVKVTILCEGVDSHEALVYDLVWKLNDY